MVAGVAVAAAAFAAGGLVSRPGAADASGPGTPRLGDVRVVNLSHVNDPATTNVFPGDPEFTLTKVADYDPDGFYQQLVHEAEHTGTHWGAPCHFLPGGRCADDLDAQDLYLPAVRIDVRGLVARYGADYEVTVADLRRWERRHGRIPRNAAVILQTGWETRWGTDAYPNQDADQVIHQPGFSLAAAQWLVDTGRIGRRGALGTDTFSPDAGINEDFSVSTLLYHERRISLENLANLDALPARGAYVLVGGPINRDGSGSTATIFGLVPPGR
jgi:kynurenine formamidase